MRLKFSGAYYNMRKHTTWCLIVLVLCVRDCVRTWLAEFCFMCWF